MNKRSLFLFAAFGLIGSLAFGTPSQAGTVPINVSLSFSLSDTSLADSISSVTFKLTNSEYGGMFNTISAAQSTGVGVSVGPPLSLVTPTVTTDATPLTYGTFTLTFDHTPVFTVSGGINFDTIATTSDVTALSGDIHLESVTIVTPQATDVLTTSQLGFTVVSIPEPASLALLGIGLSGLFTLRRFFKRTSVA